MEVTALYVLDERRYIDSHRASGNALGIRAIEATLCLCKCHLLSDALIYLLVAGDAVVGLQLGHFHTSYRRTFLCCFGFSQFLTPRLIAERGCIIFVSHNNIGLKKD